MTTQETDVLAHWLGQDGDIAAGLPAVRLTSGVER
jgi:hypothetical protein